MPFHHIERDDSNTRPGPAECKLVRMDAGYCAHEVSYKTDSSIVRIFSVLKSYYIWVRAPSGDGKVI